MTVKLYDAERVFPPPVPNIVIVYVPVGVVEEVEIVTVELQVGLQLVGLKEQDAPAGRLEHENETGCLVPLTSVAVTVVLVLLPCATLPLLGFTLIEKSKGSKFAVSVIGEFIVIVAGLAVPV
jgi:hypothetical protein